MNIKILKIIIIFFFISLFSYGQSEEKFQILHISTIDYKNVCVKFKGKEGFYAYSSKLNKRFNAHNQQFILPLNIDSEDLTYSSFGIYHNFSGTLIGNLTFRYAPRRRYNNEYPVISLSNNSFSLPTAQDIFQCVKRFSLSEIEYKKLIDKINFWDPSALSVICSPKSDIIERCSLIVQFIWSSMPSPSFPPSYVNQLSFIERLEGFQKKKFSLLCGGIGRLFIEISSILMPDVKLRHINGFECYYPKFYHNIHVNSHVFIEVKESNNDWIYIDPYFQFYFTDYSGNLLGVKEIRKMIKLNQLDQLVPNHFPANIPINYLSYLVNGELDITSIIRDWGLFKCFHWIRCTQLD